MPHYGKMILIRLTILIALTIPACATALPAATPTLENTPTPTMPPVPATPTLKGAIDVGGYKLLYECYGEGSPAVIVEAGGGDKPVVSFTWKDVIQGVYGTTRICIYDRAEVRTSEDVARDLHILLGEIPVEGPSIIAAHSLGGWHARVFTHLYPEDVAGLILVDTTTLYEDVMIALATAYPTNSPNEGSATTYDRESLLTATPPASFGALDMIISAKQVRQAGSLGDLPLVVISHDVTVDQMPPQLDMAAREQYVKVLLQAQVDLAKLSSKGEFIVANTSHHFISSHDPRTVIDAIIRMVEAIQTH